MSRHGFLVLLQLPDRHTNSSGVKFVSEDLLPMSKKASNNVTRNVSDSFAILRHYVEAYLKSFTTNKKMVDYIIFPMAGLRKTAVNTCLLCSAWRYSLSPFYVTRMCKNSLTRSTSLLVKFASFLVILILGVSRGFNFESVIQRNRAGPNVYIGPAAVEGKFGLKMGLWLWVDCILASVTICDQT